MLGSIPNAGMLRVVRTVCWRDDADDERRRDVACRDSDRAAVGGPEAASTVATIMRRAPEALPAYREQSSSGMRRAAGGC